jgi:predicted RNase H-like HicB family nuclease
MKTYNFKVVVEPDEDFDGQPSGFHAYCPALDLQGASTWGATEAEALKNIDSVVHMVVQSMLERGDRLPEEPSDQVEVTIDPRVAVTVWCMAIDYHLLRNITALLPPDLPAS